MENESPVIKRNNIRNAALLGNSGKILFWTKVFAAPEKFEDEVPYFVAIIKLENGKTIPLQLVDTAIEPKKNQKIRCVIRRLGKTTPSGVIHYGVKAKME